MSKLDMGTYMVTNKISNLAKTDVSEDDERSMILKTLNDENLLWPFSKRLLTFYNGVRNTKFTDPLKATKDFQTCAKKEQIKLDAKTINAKTFKNWLTGKTVPDHGPENRDRMFAVAFVLGLKKGQVDDLFEKVCFEMSFNVRDSHEYIYMYCFDKGLKFSDAERLIGQLTSEDETEKPTDQTIPSNVLTTKKFADESELLNSMKELRHNFSMRNVAAKKKRQDLLNELTGNNSHDGLALIEALLFRGQYSAKGKEKFLEDYKGHDTSSIAFVMDIIKGVNYAGSKGKEETKLLRNLFKQPELRAQFPDEASVRDSNPTVYALRRDIIFLYFYSFWAKALKEERKYDGDSYGEFRANIDPVLESCGLPKLYAKNPFDCLFLYCTHRNDKGFQPLEIFRSIIAPDDSDEDEEW